MSRENYSYDFETLENLPWNEMVGACESLSQKEAIALREETLQYDKSHCKKTIFRFHRSRNFRGEGGELEGLEKTWWSCKIAVLERFQAGAPGAKDLVAGGARDPTGLAGH